MQVLLNGQKHECAEASTVAALLEQAGYTGKRVAVEVNGEIVPRSHHAEHPLREGDSIEIVHAIGGG
jgi:sulfur carrier protein